jgi:hypothetical protein
MKPNTIKEKTTAQLRNQQVLNKLLAEFTQLGIVVDLKMHHMVTFNNLHRFSFQLHANDFIRLYAGKEVCETKHGSLSLCIYEACDDISNLRVNAFCQVEKPQQFDSRMITLTTNYQSNGG